MSLAQAIREVSWERALSYESHQSPVAFSPAACPPAACAPAAASRRLPIFPFVMCRAGGPAIVIRGENSVIPLLRHEWTHTLAWNFSLYRLAKMLGINPVEFDRACHDEAWGFASSRVWRASQEVIRQVA